MTKIVQAIYDMLGNSSSSRPPDTAEERAKSIFARMDENGDGKLTEEEFLKGCLQVIFIFLLLLMKPILYLVIVEINLFFVYFLQDEELSKMLSPVF